MHRAHHAAQLEKLLNYNNTCSPTKALRALLVTAPPAGEHLQQACLGPPLYLIARHTHSKKFEAHSFPLPTLGSIRILSRTQGRVIPPADVYVSFPATVLDSFSSLAFCEKRHTSTLSLREPMSVSTQPGHVQMTVKPSSLRAPASTAVSVLTHNAPDYKRACPTISIPAG